MDVVKSKQENNLNKKHISSKMTEIGVLYIGMHELLIEKYVLVSLFHYEIALIVLFNYTSYYI